MHIQTPPHIQTHTDTLTAHTYTDRHTLIDTDTYTHRHTDTHTQTHSLTHTV